MPGNERQGNEGQGNEGQGNEGQGNGLVSLSSGLEGWPFLLDVVEQAIA